FEKLRHGTGHFAEEGTLGIYNRAPMITEPALINYRPDVLIVGNDLLDTDQDRSVLHRNGVIVKKDDAESFTDNFSELFLAFWKGRPEPVLLARNLRCSIFAKTFELGMYERVATDRPYHAARMGFQIPIERVNNFLE